MNRRSGILWFGGVVLLAAPVAVFHSRIHFDWAAFLRQLRQVSVGHVLAGIALIYATFWMRALRWSVFLTPAKKVPASTLVGPQFIGFTAVALFGRLADLTRPYLLARRTHLSRSSQVAVYTIERMFDLGAAAIVFSSALAFTPSNDPHHGLFVHVGTRSLAATVALALFAFFVRISGTTVAAVLSRWLTPLSKPLAESIVTKILGFRDGLRTITSARELAFALLLSLAMWAMIGEAYVQTVHAFTGTPEFASLTFSRTMLLMAASLGASLVQLPVVGWFTQIAATAAAMQAFYGAPIEAATACGALLLLVTLLSIIPTGIFFARIERVSLSTVAKDSGSAATDLTSATAAKMNSYR
jgi:hypothetical protein